MVDLLLLGASGLAREVLAVLAGEHYTREIAVLDDRAELRHTLVGGAPVLGTIDEVGNYPEAAIVICVGRGTRRETIAARLTLLGVADHRYATVVHPAVEIPPGCVVGAGSILLAGVVLTALVQVGRHVVAMPHVTLTHDNVVADFATLCAGVTLGGSVRVGRGAYLGMNASVRENVTVGAGTVLGMGAVLLTDLPDGETWAGLPARSLGRRAQ
ncbi:NeuD/PglB/VioB family sugar acetyltransferase [Cryobacterium arcticum]|uniref:Acyltransferase n=1 Tax=Cryobacterium arcticum TaxID=670052 RepID=A0A1B1BNJ8_9MICO|nr:NeuD/PglB/VioB family sugar acetyltransferase [Cryobacterium arcticum]ANP74101.1 acyltransferase [Cryobacterium arcticum]